MRMPSFAWMKQEWRMPKVPIAFFILELLLTVAALALFGIADPDLYRSLLWQEGADHGWNSDPIELLYAFANYKPIPAPTPWNQFITTFNVVIALLSMFVMLAKIVMYICHAFPPLVSAVVHAIFTALYAISISQQAASDMSDPNHPSKIPWYITKSCGAPVKPRVRGYCMQAKGSFAVTIMLCALFFTYFAFSLFSYFPAIAKRSAQTPKPSDMESPSSTFDDKKWEMEMDQYPLGNQRASTTKPPMTPRTLAFNTLDGSIGARKPNRDLPLRHHIAMGKETYKGPGWR